MESSPLFAILPYAAVALLVLGIVARYAMASRRPAVPPEDIAEAKAVFGSWLFWISIVLLLGGHLLGLLFPTAILSWNTSAGGLYLLEGLGLVLGFAGVVSCAALVWRHLGHSGKSRMVEFFDTIFLGIVFTALLSGVLIAVFYRWGSSWGVMILQPYVMSILRGQPAILYVAQMKFLVQLHVLATFAAMAVLPLTRLATLFVAAVNGGMALASLPMRVAANAFTGWTRKHNPSALFWPEED